MVDLVESEGGLIVRLRVADGVFLEVPPDDLNAGEGQIVAPTTIKKPEPRTRKLECWKWKLKEVAVDHSRWTAPVTSWKLILWRPREQRQRWLWMPREGISLD